jgi:glycosyltransferase involved in cell wall biosynthesis
MSLISYVIPVYREGSNIPPLVEAIARNVAETGEEHEIIFVDDGSPDDTWEILRTQPCQSIRLSRNFGKEAALAAGLERARGDAVIIMDADFQHPPALIPEMIRVWKCGQADVVEAVKEDRGEESLWYRACARAFYCVLNRCCRLDLRGASDFKLLDAEVVKAWRRMGEANLFFRGMSAWVGFQRATIPFRVPPRAVGRSRWSLLSLCRLALVGLTAYTAAPLHLVTAMGSAFFLFALVLGVRALIVKFQGAAIDGFTLLILLILVMGSLILIGLGIIGEYLARIYIEVKGRPRYIVRDILPGRSADVLPRQAEKPAAAPPRARRRAS